MVDLLMVLLLFLIMAYSTDPPLLATEASFQLPVSHATGPVQPAARLEIAQGGIYFNGHRATGTQWYLDNEDSLIREVYDMLLQSGSTTLQLVVDAGAPYALVRKAIFTAQQAGVSELSLIAASRSSL